MCARLLPGFTEFEKKAGLIIIIIIIIMINKIFSQEATSR